MRDARDRGLIDAAVVLVAADSTGLNASRCSEYFTRRSGKKKRHFPKVSQAVDTGSHVTLAAVPERGPSADDRAFERLSVEAHRRVPYRAPAADAGYDAERHHTFLRERLGVIGVIPPTRGRPAKPRDRPPGGFWRRFLHAHWPRGLYGQRWQCETRFSMEKRKLGPGLISRREDAQDAEQVLRAVTLNLMLEPAEG